ncbi:AAA family ATPase [Prevotella sp. AGR2160]|uniref:AAA family ATPase n=1 Tax=Prevotella sp. AGR2160 TaxID=1280674 RepID=UPI0004021A59|nr:AAA family ATPase [Prevotella sp. AGR2160]
MIFKKLNIKNFRSYYGENEFEFREKGLTLIVGGNGDGKTTFFEALQWLFNTTIYSQDTSLVNFSEMRKSKMEVGDTAEVSVTLDFFHDGEKRIQKSFIISRVKDDNKGKPVFKAGALSFLGFNSDGVERVPVDGGGEVMVKRYYDSFIRRFSLFKGESTLNVFNDPTALQKLVDTFSNVKEFDKMVDMTDEFEKKSNRQYLTECASDKKVSKEAKFLETQLDNVTNNIQDLKKDIKNKQESLNLYTDRLSKLEQDEESADKFKDISDLLENKEKEARRLRALSERTNFNTALLDKLWILCDYPKVLNEFKQKAAALSKEKRRQSNEFIAQKNKELGKLEAQEEILGELANGATPLPWYLPNEETMEEMIKDGICKVCGRPVEKGSEAYEFMLHKLNDYKEHVKAKALKQEKEKIIKDEELFKSNFIEELHNLSISLGGNREEEVANITNEISDEIDFVAKRREDLKKVEQEIQDAKDEKARLLIKVGASEESFKKSFADIKGIFTQKEEAGKRLVELSDEMKHLQDQQKDLEAQLNALDPSNSQVKRFRDVHHVFDLIAKAFRKAKDQNLRDFLNGLESKANEYLERLSVVDFHGRVHIYQKIDGQMSIQLLSSNGTEIVKKSGSQETLLYISILFAIRDFTQNKREEAYPLIFDAATSSFGDEKEDDFYSIFNGIENQCIIATKDFIDHGHLKMDDLNKIIGTVYQISKAEGYDKENLASIRTVVTKIK